MRQPASDAQALLLHPADDVAVLKRTIPSGTPVRSAGIELKPRSDIPAGHKIAVRSIAQDAPVRKYGQTIGFASEAIAPGDHVHTHNLGIRTFDRDYAFCADARAFPLHPPEKRRTFQGYARPDGRAGTRNTIAIIPTVNCAASAARSIAQAFPLARLQRDFPNVDGVTAYTHKSGCCIQPGHPHEMLRRTLAGIAQHPNVGGCLLVGLGCETVQSSALLHDFALNSGKNVGACIALDIQALGGLRRTVEAGTAALQAMLPRANACRRSTQPLAKLTLAMNCGGSDANSGITANPALGIAVDELIRHGATAVLAETPEIYGAEHLLTRRAATREVGEELVAIVRWWEKYVQLHGASIDNNPTFGNKAGGLTTIYEKSLGAVAKAGQSPLMAVYAFAEKVTAQGLCFMDTPGFDPVSMTGLLAGACNLGVFTTGRGSVFGSKPAPCLKVASNTPLYQSMADDMDIDAGSILDDKETVGEVGRRIFDELVAIASGKKTKSEAQGVGDEEFAPWIIGPTL